MHAGLELVLNGLTVIRDFRKVRNTWHQKVEFDPTQGEIKEKPAKKYISIQRG
jgi:nitrite reductase/ring-hydroxylating ferredoxin subunit